MRSSYLLTVASIFVVMTGSTPVRAADPVCASIDEIVAQIDSASASLSNVALRGPAAAIEAQQTIGAARDAAAGDSMRPVLGRDRATVLDLLRKAQRLSGRAGSTRTPATAAARALERALYRLASARTLLLQAGIRSGCGTGGSQRVALNPAFGSTPLFPPTNWWHTDVSGWSVAANSDAVIDFIGRTRGFHPDFGTDFGIPYVFVSGEQPRLPVLFEYSDESDPGAPGFANGYPIPEESKSVPGYIEGNIPAGGSSGDRHMLIVDRDNNRLFELYALQFSGGQWRAGSGAVFNLDTNDRRPEGWTSADAAGLAILPGLVRADEVFERGVIDHAIRFTVRGTKGYVFPASHDATSGSGGDSRPPLGTRVRLKRSVDISRFSAPVQVILRAMKLYGLILADNGSDWFFQGAPDARWNDSLMHDEFLQVTGNDFEVVDDPLH